MPICTNSRALLVIYVCLIRYPCTESRVQTLDFTEHLKNAPMLKVDPGESEYANNIIATNPETDFTLDTGDFGARKMLENSRKKWDNEDREEIMNNELDIEPDWYKNEESDGEESDGEFDQGFDDFLLHKMEQQSREVAHLRSENDRLWSRLVNISQKLESSAEQIAERGTVESQLFHLVLRTLEASRTNNASCHSPLGMKNRYIPDSAITASQEYSPVHSARHVRLDDPIGWYSNGVTDPEAEQWVQVRFDIVQRITKLLIQRAPHPSGKVWMRKFRLSISFDGLHWENFKQNGRIKLLDGTRRRKEHNLVELQQPIYGRYFRVISVAAHGGLVGFRFELYGCPING